MSDDTPKGFKKATHLVVGDVVIPAAEPLRRKTIFMLTNGMIRNHIMMTFTDGTWSSVPNNLLVEVEDNG